MRNLWILLVLIAFSLVPSVGADPQDLQVVKLRAYAGEDMPRQAFVEVQVKNRGSAAESGAILVVTLTPAPVDRNRLEARDSYTPVELEQEIGTLQPGEARTFRVETPFGATDGFTSRTGQFSGQRGQEELSIRFQADIR
ncbi:MAG: hypothetical protein AB1758_17110 [Candidatus Eremiobacterota bacterium]